MRPWLALLALAACGATEPAATADDAAMAAAMRKAVADTDAAYRDASARPVPRTAEQTVDRAG